jgi:hypothetical protein
MDLTRLYNLTTSELRQEAERLGVTDTYAMSRGQLIHAIRNQVDGPPAEGLLGKVIGFAKWALAAAQEEAPRGRESGAESDAGTVTVPESVTESVTESGAESVTESVAVAVAAPVAESAAVTESVAAAGAESGAETVAEAVTATEPVPASVAEGVAVSAPRGVRPGAGAAVTERVAVPVQSKPDDSGPPSRPPAGVFSRSAGVFEEPFPTRTMARILAEQGHFKRSLAIYDALLRNEPTNPELSAEIDDVRARSRARRPHVS